MNMWTESGEHKLLFSAHIPFASQVFSGMVRWWVASAIMKKWKLLVRLANNHLRKYGTDSRPGKYAV